MSLQDKVEKYLSNADFILFGVGETEAVIQILFPKTNFKHYSNVLSQKQFHTYFNDRKNKLVIYTSKEGNTRISFVDIKTGDTINTDHLKFEIKTFTLFLERIKQGNKKIPLVISGLSEDGSTMVLPHIHKMKPLVVHGYSLKDDRIQE